jgi:hypothetical protein
MKAKRKIFRAPANPGRLGLVNIITMVVLLLTLGGAIFVTCGRYLKPANIEYEGRIVDKWAGYSESDHGSTPYWRLLVEQNGGERITVRIDSDTYARTQVGMWIQAHDGSIELSARQGASPAGHQR